MKIETSTRENGLHFTLKIALLAVLSLFLLIPLQMIKEIIEERKANEKYRKKYVQ